MVGVDVHGVDQVLDEHTALSVVGLVPHSDGVDRGLMVSTVASKSATFSKRSASQKRSARGGRYASVTMRRLLGLLTVLLISLLSGCGDHEPAAGTSTRSSTPDSTTASAGAPSMSNAEVRASVEETVGLIEAFDRELANGSSADALTAGTRASTSCDELMFEVLPSVPGFDEAGTMDMSLHCGMLSAAVISVERGESLPDEVDFAATAQEVRSVWEKAAGPEG